ncbi:diphthine--ammonia ligase [Antarcticibacterium sp. 1MA-6-2]|uniref:Dph6-related ATP pyrophosphatase n=1 Tax=Antarcticibacterium sp. 1MA-6-2 TaxID=2908210 RepID=UPI001F340142|nr:diphthine--ammonia ligase [Antarcticibacterium sp. 1MA-6-2]UJH91484.1 diphthine--ammonia ligase [Antarcticibacterium sp. 1MA-6-2]
MKKSYLNWSSGKDAALALYELQKEGKFSVEKLVTTINSETNQISMHGVRTELLLRQAKSIGIPLYAISLNGNVSLSDYNLKMTEAVKDLKSQNMTHSIFGDIFLEDLREYREKELNKVGIEAVFPLWKRDSSKLIEVFLEAGFKAITVCVNSKFLDKSYCGKVIDKEFLASLPDGVDPCGENGEFHTFVFDGPIFKEPVKFEVGEVVEKFYTPSSSKDDCFKEEETSWDTAFWYCDLLPI